MVIALNQSLQDSLSNLLTSTQSQARNVSFNIQFAALQDTVIGRINEEITDAANIEGRQRDLERVNASVSSLTDRRNAVARFEFDNTSNNQRFAAISALATSASTLIGLGDNDEDTFSADEVASFASTRDDFLEATGLLVEMNNPEFFDGNHATILRGLVDEFAELEAVEGAVDAADAETSTNDNRRILELIDEIQSAASSAVNTSATLNLMADNIINDIDGKLTDLRFEQIEITEIQAVEAEFAANEIRTKYATFLQAIEIGFDFNSQSLDRLVEAMDPDNFTSNTIVSFIA